MGLDELEAAWNAKADRFNQWHELGLDEIVEFAQEVERDACANILNLNRSEAQLMAGEITAQEWRTVAAILRALQARVRSNLNSTTP